MLTQRRTQRLKGALAAGAVTALLLGSGAALGADVILDPGTPTVATGIEDLDVGGTLYNVSFEGPTEAVNVYSQPPQLPFSDSDSAAIAIDAAVAALNGANVLRVGPNGASSSASFRVGFEIFGSGVAESVRVVEAVAESGTWLRVPQVDALFYNADSRMYASFTLASGAPPSQPISAASLPSSRSVQVRGLATAFATIINGGTGTATDCSIAPATSVDAGFAYQTTNESNIQIGTPNTPADIPAGGSQNFIFAFVPDGAFAPTEVRMTYKCSNSSPAPVIIGLNSLLLSASATPVPDVVALAATLTADGIVDLPGTNGSNAFSVATVNVGSTGTLTAEPILSAALPVVVSICETNPTTGACLSSAGSTATSSVAGGATPTFSIFVTAQGTVPFDPAGNRIVVEFRDGSTVRGSTSVAVRTQ